ncbi:VOC family protein [Flammeovirga sp. SJP92]|uniref:VOC family protein n=1 Tax=Flammeovirga sp. SJP92 TaxID=1775430 RepID=UPI0007884717|nr:VOC family protein [Flammeovirga sp. SJP92]KXX70572.1 glyoxalase [Flammeovirga sp. SJP92]
MKIEHIAIWTKDLERLRAFYMRYFGMASNEKYINPKKGFSSYFLSMKGENTRLEIMHNDCIKEHLGTEDRVGITHLAFSVGSRMKVDEMTEKFRKEGYEVFGEPRITGDGYYESVILDPDGNKLELVAE